jgi:hypothetical protein
LYGCEKKKDEITRGVRNLHNKKLYNAYSSPNIIIMIKIRKVGWTGPVACVGKKRNACRISSSSSVILTRLGGPRSRPTTFQKI